MSRTKIELTSKRFSRWTVLSEAPRTKGQSLWLCVCDCGNEAVIPSATLRNGLSQSCGCLKKELNDATKLPVEIKKSRRAKASKIRDAQPERKSQKAAAQLRYQISDKAALSQLNRYAKKKNKRVLLTDDEFISFRALPCHICNNAIERTGVPFILTNPRGQIELSNMKPTCGVCKLIKPKEGFDYIKHSAAVLRRGWKRTPLAAIVLQKSRKAVGRYECADCKQLFKDSEIQIDHILPVIDIETGFVDLNTFARRLFCDDNNLQVLCKICHKAKSKLENLERRRIKREKT